MPIEIPQGRLDYLNPRLWTRFVEDAPLPADFIGAKFLPLQDEYADKILVEIGQYTRPMAPFAAVDAEAPEINWGPVVTQAWFDALQIKHKAKFLGSQLRWLRYYGDPPVGMGASPASLMAATARKQIDKAMTLLNDAVDTRLEWLQLNALQGAVTVHGDASSPVDFSITYPVSTFTAPTLWSDHTTSDPILDLSAILKDIYMWTYGTLVVSRATMFDLAQNKNIRNMAFTQVPNPPSILGQNIVSQIFKSHLGLELIEYNAVYTSRTDDGTAITDTASRILPAGKALLLPTVNPGYTATVPQELKNWQTGKYVWKNEPSNNPGMQDPIRHELGCGWGGMPVLTFPKRIFVLTVA